VSRNWTTWLVASAVLAGCAAPTQLVTNQKPSETVRAKGFKTYREVWLVPPKADPGGVVPRLKTGIEDLGFKVRLLAPDRPIEGSQGTAFVIGADGWMLTCAHVTGDEKVATVTLNGQRLLADVVRSDKTADLALLKLRGALPAGSSALPFRAAARPAAMGEDVFTIGYPLSRMLGNTARMSRGLLSATAGLRDDAREVQVSAEIHPGNSGGPLLDREGNVIGVIHRIINPAAVQRATGGALPQNINFAIKAAPVLDFVKAASAQAFAALGYDRGAGVDQVNRGVAKVQAGVAPTDAERRDKMLVLFGMVTRAPAAGEAARQVLALTAADYETREALFSVLMPSSQVADVSDADVEAVMAHFRSAVRAR